MKVTITSDGTSNGTTITDQDGRALQGVTGLNWRIGIDEPSRAEVELCFIPLQRIEAEAIMIGPEGKEVRRIEYADGSVDEFPE